MYDLDKPPAATNFCRSTTFLHSMACSCYRPKKKHEYTRCVHLRHICTYSQGHIPGDISLETYPWGHIPGDISLGAYPWGHIPGSISLGAYPWGHFPGGISLGGISLGGTYPWGHVPGGISLGAFPWGHIPGRNIPGGNISLGANLLEGIPWDMPVHTYEWTGGQSTHYYGQSTGTCVGIGKDNYKIDIKLVASMLLLLG